MPVTGKLIIPGHTAEGVRIEFHPEVAAGSPGYSSIGETDPEGNYKLFCALGEQVKDGAVAGKHRVVLQDLRLAQSETGRGIPVRFPPTHSAILTTPITVEVRLGEPTLDIDLSPP